MPSWEEEAYWYNTDDIRYVTIDYWTVYDDVLRLTDDIINDDVLVFFWWPYSVIIIIIIPIVIKYRYIWFWLYWMTVDRTCGKLLLVLQPHCVVDWQSKTVLTYCVCSWETIQLVFEGHVTYWSIQL